MKHSSWIWEVACLSPCATLGIVCAVVGDSLVAFLEYSEILLASHLIRIHSISVDDNNNNGSFFFFGGGFYYVLGCLYDYPTWSSQHPGDSPVIPALLMKAGDSRAYTVCPRTCIICLFDSKGCSFTLHSRFSSMKKHCTLIKDGLGTISYPRMRTQIEGIIFWNVTHLKDLPVTDLLSHPHCTTSPGRTIFAL